MQRSDYLSGLRLHLGNTLGVKNNLKARAQLLPKVRWRMERWVVPALSGHMGGSLSGSDSTIKNRPGFKGKLFLKTTAPTVFTCPHTQPHGILLSEIAQAKCFSQTSKKHHGCRL